MTEEERMKQYGGVYRFSPADGCETFSAPTNPATPYLAQSLVTTAGLWAMLHPFATQAQRMALLMAVGERIGVEGAFIS